jgi:hypothetical protein
MASRSGASAPKAVAGEIDAVGVVNEPVEDGVGISRVANKGVPIVDGDLTGEPARPICKFVSSKPGRPKMGLGRARTIFLFVYKKGARCSPLKSYHGFELARLTR